jgi:capsular exopolysaccharide synthesis family protein
MDDNTLATTNGTAGLTPASAQHLIREGLLEIALRHRWVIAASTWLALFTGVIYLLRATPIYISSARLYVEQTGPRIISEFEGVMTQSKNYLYTQSELIRSTPIMAAVTEDSQIRQFQTFAGIDNLVGYLKKAINATVGKRDDIIEVAFACPYPKEAAQIVNAVVDSYVDYHSARKRSTVSEVLKILQKEKAKRDEELSRKFKELLEFTRTNGVASVNGDGDNIVFQRLAKLSEALTDAQLATISTKADYEAVSNMMSEPAKVKQFASAQPAAGLRVLVNDEEARLQTELQRLKAELKNARYFCTDQHPTIQAIGAKIQHMENQLNEQARDFAVSYCEAMLQHWQTARQRQDELAASLEDQQELARNLSIKTAEYSVLQSELKRTEKLCDILDDRIKELSVTEDAGALNISILEVARPAEAPSRPQKTKVMAIFLVVGLMIGGGLAVLCDLQDYCMRSTEEVSAVLRLPVLGVVPTMLARHGISARGHSLWRRLRRRVTGVCGKILAAVYPAAAVPLRSAGSQRQGGRPEKSRSSEDTIVARGQEVRLSPRSIVAEAYRTIRTAVFFGVPKGQARTVVISSPAPGDGKSTLVSNLAIAMAQAGQRTLVLDCDFRKPIQHKIFCLSREKGLSSVLAAITSLSEAIQPGPVEKLDVLPCGPEVPNPSEILNSCAFMEMLKDLSERYERVIIDSPPVTPVADSQILGAISDITLLVLRAGRSTRKHSQQARDGLLSVGAHILGVVINDVSLKSGRYGYYGGYKYYRHYGYGYGRESESTSHEQQEVCV